MNAAQPLAETGVIHGRFQILHHDHLRYLLSALPLCRHLVVGITNPDPLLTRHEPVEPHRGTPGANPLTFYERLLMVRDALKEAGVPAGDFSVVPFPISFPALYHCYLPMDALFFLSIYDDWGREKLQRFEALGLKTHVLRMVAADAKGISADDIRRRIIRDEPWEHLVPPAVARILRQQRIIERLKAEACPAPGK